MEPQRYITSLGEEIAARRARVRDLMYQPRYLTDGEWKESDLRTVLRRILPQSVTVGRGFVVSEAQTSHQTDILIYDASVPVLFRDGDLAFVTPDAVLGLIEVKSEPAKREDFREAIRQLAGDV